MRSTRCCFLLWLIWTANSDARRVETQIVTELKSYDKADHYVFSHGSILTKTQNRTRILCFGLCIAALGGVGLFLVFGVGGAATVSIGYAAKAVVDQLSEEGVEAQQIKETVALAASWASVPLETIEGEKERMTREAITPVSWTSQDVLVHIFATCGTDMEAKGLGASESSSKSGAVFFNCKTPEPTSAYPRMLVKGAIRDSDSSPEWQIFQTLSRDPGLQERYSSATLLNKMVLGFDAYSLHWLVLEDIKATRVLHQLKNKLGIAILHPNRNREATDMPKFDAYDIKPAGSSAPQLPGCAQRVEELAAVMGPINDFKGWSNIVGALGLDLTYLKRHAIIDESLFVQVAGPFDVDEDHVNEVGEKIVLEVLGGTPMCAYQVKEGKMAIVCISILDYVLSMSFMKSVQNVFQYSRWNDYEDKMQTLLSCLGDLSQSKCAQFKAMADGEWLQIITADYAKHYKQPGVKNAMDHLESNYRCCCNIKETQNALTMSTACAWLSRKDQVTAVGFCPRGLQHYSAASGGCMDVEPPPLPPPEPSTRCAFYHNCCCYDRDWMPHERLPVSENGLCNCQWSCPGSYNEYSKVEYCPAIYSELKDDTQKNATRKGSKGKFVSLVEND